jgi:hypothetical protein
LKTGTRLFVQGDKKLRRHCAAIVTEARERVRLP